MRPRPFYAFLWLAGRRYALGLPIGDCGVPEISRFYGMVVYVNANDHVPPHIHVRHAGEQGRIRVDPDVAVLDGDLAPAMRRRALKWAAMHRLANWYLAQAGRPTSRVAALKE